jgi:hypothetical protein
MLAQVYDEDGEGILLNFTTFGGREEKEDDDDDDGQMNVEDLND